MLSHRLACSALLVTLSACAAEAPPDGLAGSLDARRAAADTVCSCASALDWSVDECLDALDAPTYEEATVGATDAIVCLEEALVAVPDDVAVFDCQAEAAHDLERCAAEAGCNGDRLNVCLDRLEGALARCPVLSEEFEDAQAACERRLVVQDDPAGWYVDYMAGFLREACFAETDGVGCVAKEDAYFACATPIAEANAALMVDHAACLVATIDDAPVCFGDQAPCVAEVRRELAYCPPLPEELALALDSCWR